MATFGSNFIRIDQDWETLKNTIENKSLSMQYDASTDGYEIFAIDSPIVYLSFIYIGTVPYTSNVTQEQNDINKADFLTNYESSANERLELIGHTRIEQAARQSLKGNVGGYKFASRNDLPISGNGSPFSWPQLESNDSRNIESNQRVSVVSDSYEDSSSGTGVQMVRLIYLPEGLTETKYEDIIVNGTTPTNSIATDVRHIEEFYAIRVGSNESAVGNIMLKDADGYGTNISNINSGENDFRSLTHHVAVGRVAYITERQFNIRSNGSSSFALTYEGVIDGYSVEHLIDVEIISNYLTSQERLTVPFRVVGPSHIRIRARSEAEPQDVGGRLVYWEEIENGNS